MVKKLKFWKNSFCFVYLILVITPWIVFGQSLGFDFVWDDDLVHITANPYFNPPSFGNLLHFWTGLYEYLYIPVSYTIWGIIYRVSESNLFHFSNPELFHLLNIFFHSLNGLCVYVLLKMIVKDQWAACAGAVLYLVHPLQVETVVWVSEFRGLSAAFFGFLSLIFYFKAYQPGMEKAKNTLLFPTVSLLGYTLSVLSKPSAVVFIVFVVLFEFFLFKSLIKDIVKRISLWVIPTLIVSILTATAQVKSATPYPFYGKFILWIDAIVFYSIKIIAPFNLATSYARTPDYVIAHWSIHGLWLFLVLAGIIYVLYLKNKPLAAVSILIVIAGFLPTSGLNEFLFQRWSNVADRYLYLSMLGVSIGFASVFKRVSQTKLRYSFICILVFFAGWSAMVQVPVWKNNLTLWSHCIKVLKENPPAFISRGIQYQKLKKFSKAMDDFNTAVELDPNFFESYFYRGKLYKELKDYPNALKDFDQAIKIDPSQADAYENRAQVYDYLKLKDKALNDFSTAIRIDPEFALAYSNRGFFYLKSGDFSNALKDFNQAIALDDGNMQTFNNRGYIFKERKEYHKALADFNKAIDIDPNYGFAYINRAYTWFHLGKLPEALADFLTAQRLGQKIDSAFLESIKQSVLKP